MTRVSLVYAQALFSLAQDEGLDERILNEMNVITDTAGQEPGFLRVLAAPNIAKEERCRVLDTVFAGRVHPYVLNFMKLMTEKGYAKAIPDAAKAYRELFHEAHGILPVRAVTATSLTQSQRARLTAKLESLTGKRILLDNVIDPSCLGGMRIDYDGKRVDDTVRHRLDSVRSLLINTAL